MSIVVDVSPWQPAPDSPNGFAPTLGNNYSNLTLLSTPTTLCVGKGFNCEVPARLLCRRIAGNGAWCELKSLHNIFSYSMAKIVSFFRIRTFRSEELDRV